MIPSSSSQLTRRTDANLLDTTNIYLQVRHVLDQVATTTLVAVRRTSKYASFTFFLLFFRMETFLGDRDPMFPYLPFPDSSLGSFCLNFSSLSLKTPFINLLSSGLTPGYTLGAVLGTLGGIALLVMIFFICYGRRFFPDEYYEEESYNTSDASPTPGQG